MAAELALAADLGVIEGSADPAEFVVAACERAKSWLEEALEHGDIEQVAEIKSQAEAVRVYTAQKQLGRDAQLAAAEIVRRAERGIGVAIRKGQQNGEIRRQGQGSKDGQLPGDSRRLPSPTEFVTGDELSGNGAGIYHLTDGVSDADFEDALGEARAEANLARANLVRKIRQRCPDPAERGGQVPDPADRSPVAAARRRELIGELAGRGMTSRQIGGWLGIADHRVRQIARQHGIGIRADAVVGRTRRLDSSRIVRDTAQALEGMVMAVELADPAGLDPAETAAWAASMTRSIRALSTFVQQLKGAIR
jgi:hypothetical protein